MCQGQKGPAVDGFLIHGGIVKKVLWVFPALGFVTLSAFAAPFYYPDSTKMTCLEAQAFIREHGKAILATCREYGYFSVIGCNFGQKEIPGFVRTKDVSYCYVGSYCASQGQGSYLQDGGDTCER
jgi:hypothetical protein